MKRLFSFVTLALALIFCTAVSEVRAVTAKPALPPFIEGTGWQGQITVVSITGEVQEVAADLEIKSQTESFFRADLTENFETARTVALSGYIGPLKDQVLRMTGVNTALSATMFKPKGQKTLHMTVQGHNFSDGSTFIGILVQQ